MESWQQRFEEQLIFSTPSVQVGRFHMEASHPQFESGLPPGHYVAAFPEIPVEIRNPGREPFVTDRTVATLYNPDDVYQRRARDPRGDRCWWLSVTEDELRGFLPCHHSAADLLPFPVAPCSDVAFLMQRLVVGWCQDPDRVRPERVEHTTRVIVRDLIATGRTAAMRHAKRARSRSSWLARRARAVLRQSYRTPLSLRQIADRAGCSPYHLSRVFRRETGASLHGYRTTLRLRTGVDELLARRGAINDIAFGLGFASHSHFTDAFRRAFSLTPSAFLHLVDRGEAPELGSMTDPNPA
ncbi:MAG: AraC family transcriptional regulator [Acidobacteriota bacterium]